MGSQQELFDEWAQKWELTVETVGVLRDNGFSTLRSCTLLNAATIQKNFKSLPLAQSLQLQDAVSMLSAQDAAPQPDRAQQTQAEVPAPAAPSTSRPVAASDSVLNASLPSLLRLESLAGKLSW